MGFFFAYFFFFYIKLKIPELFLKGGLVFGFLYFLGNVYWIYHSLYFYGSVPFILSYVIVGLLALYLALYPAFLL